VLIVEYKILIENLWVSKRFSARRLVKEFPKKLEKMNTRLLYAKVT